MKGIATLHRAEPGRRSASNARLGTWWVSRSVHGDRPCVSFKCPRCEHASVLYADGHGHEIHADGSVTPSVLCRSKDDDGKPCGWHETVRLSDWLPLRLIVDPRSPESKEGR